MNKNEIQNSGKNEPILQAKNNLDYLSEFTKFKTELCHSWIYIYLIFYNYSVFMLMEKMI